MVHEYLDATLEGLGPLKDPARRFLEEHLVAGDGSRRLMMEEHARAALRGLSEEEASEVLKHLETQAVLHAQAHGNSRYFELGHDWLARKVFELKQERLRQEEEAQKRREERARQEEETRRLREEQARREAEAARRLREERAARRKLALVAGGTAAVALLMGLLLLWALGQRKEAEAARAHAREQALMAGAREMRERADFATASKLLLEVKHPSQVHGWKHMAYELLRTPVQITTLRCPGDVNNASFSPDGSRIALSCGDGTVRVWRADGMGEPVVLRGHEASVWSASFSPDGQRLVTASADKTARVWKAEEPVVLTEPELQRLLRMANNDCLSPELRRTYLDDNETQAQQRYEECERSYGRPPFFTSISPPRASAPTTP